MANQKNKNNKNNNSHKRVYRRKKNPMKRVQNKEKKTQYKVLYNNNTLPTSNRI